MRRPALHPSLSGARSERGFTVVEVVIAAMIAAGILSGLALAVGAAGKLQGVSKVKARMANVAESVLEEVQNNRTWMDNCERRLNSVQNLAGRIDATTLQDAESQTTYALVLQATARDFDVDGVGAKDMDGSTCDGFDMLVRISLPAADKPRLGAMPPVEIRTVIDTSGTVAKGALIVEACAAMNQVDDRLAIGGCAAGPGVSEARGNFTLMPGCQNAANCDEYDAIKHKPGHRRYESPHVATERIDVNISVTGPFGALPAPTKLAKGLWLYTDVPIGEYTITAPTSATTPSSMGTPRTLQRWYTQEAPSRGRDGVKTKVAVEFGNRSSALIAYKPKPPASTNINILLQRTIYYVTWNNRSHTVNYGFQSPWDANCFPMGTDTDGLTLWLCENREIKAQSRYWVPESVTTKTAWGTRNPTDFQISPQPYNRVVKEVAKDQFQTVQNQVTSQGHGNEAGVDGNPAQRSVNLRPTEAGLNTAIRSNGGGSFTPISPGSGSLMNRTWIDPVNGWANGDPTHQLLYQEDGECYVSMTSDWIKGGFDLFLGDAWYQHEEMIGGLGNSTGSGWSVNRTATHYTDREGNTCTKPGGPCGSVWWQPTGQLLTNACTLLFSACDVTVYWYALNVKSVSSVETYWQHATSGAEYIGATSPSPTDPLWTGPHTRNVGPPGADRPDAADAAAKGYMEWGVRICDGYNPPMSCNAAGEACGVSIYVPPQHPGAKGTYPAANLGPSLTA